MRVVDDLADQEGALGGELGARFVRVLDRTIHAVAESELARQAERDVTHGEAEPGATHRIHHATVVIRDQGAFDGALEPEAFAVVGLLHASI